MTWTYDLSTDIGQIRLELGDEKEENGVKPDGSNFSDEELTYILTKEGSVGCALAGACEILATQWAKVADSSAGPLSESLSKVQTSYEARAKALRRQYGGGTLGAFAIAPSRVDGYSEEAEEEE